MSQPSVFGIRHLSPNGAWHVRRFLDELKPSVVLIEGLSDADDLLGHVVDRKTKPPIALLAYTDCLPVRTLVYPMARYSPEYQALLWAKERRVSARFIDLPSSIFLALQAKIQEPPPPEEEAPPEPALSRGDIYERFARHYGEPDYETFWERQFEHGPCDRAYRLAAHELGQGLREFDAGGQLWRAENLAREAFMRRRIHAAVAEGHKPAKIAVICGAFHAPALTLEQPPISDEELGRLPRLPSKLTLMPYSYFRLSSQSGYGAGNRAPAYFDLMWDCLEAGDLRRLPAEYLAQVARHLRDSGTWRSPSEVIEGVRLANTMTALKDGLAPTLRDLQDAAITLMGQGEVSVVQEAMARVEVGTAIGALGEGVPQTSIQEDFERQLERLKLAKYRGAVRQELGLDLRENRRAQSQESAYLDLDRSSFLHRLAVLGVSFAKKAASGQQSGSWKEIWHLQWTPESEIELVEAVLLGETIEIAAAFKFKTRLDEAESVREAATVIREACECGLLASMELARSALQRLAAESTQFTAIAQAARELSLVIRYGDVRRFDPEPLRGLLQELFVQGCLGLRGAANCDNDAARGVLEGMAAMNQVSQDFYDLVDEELWPRELGFLADADHLNPKLSGYACAILLERNVMDNQRLAREVSRRLSPGVEADLGAGWFEGLSLKNRAALISRLPLWEQLADYVASLDDEQFKRALVFLRRAFGSFSPHEKRSVAENLGELWGVGADAASEALSQELTETEREKLEELNEFDFGDL